MVAVLENVRLLTSMKNAEGKRVVDDIAAEFAQRDYRIRSFEVNAKDYGVPQHRERVLFIAVRDDLAFSPSLPPRSHGDGDLLRSLAPCCRRRTAAARRRRARKPECRSAAAGRQNPVPS